MKKIMIAVASALVGFGTVVGGISIYQKHKNLYLKGRNY